MKRTTFISISLTSLALAACSQPKADYLTSCMFETNAKGSYSSAATEVPVVSPVPGTGATQAQADALNACIQRRAAADGKA